MKRHMALVICAFVSLSASLAAVADVKKNVPGFRDLLVAYSKEFYGESPSNLVSILQKQAKNTNFTQEEAIAEMSALAREYRRLSEETSLAKTQEEEARDYNARCCLRVLQLISCFGDRCTLPLFDEMSAASNTWIRLNGYVGYIKVSGVDSVPFLNKILMDGLYTERDHCQIYDNFHRELMKIDNDKSSEKFRKGLTFLLVSAQRDTMGNAANQLDKILCKLLPDYSISVQREQVATKFAKDGNEFYKNHFGKIRDEIEKTPTEKRKDFKAKGELLDPDRSK